MYTMKKLLLIMMFGVLVACSTTAEADHSDNGKCLDEIKHWNGLSDAQKEQADAKAKMNDGANHWAQGNKADCEADVKQAIILATD